MLDGIADPVVVVGPPTHRQGLRLVVTGGAAHFGVAANGVFAWNSADEMIYSIAYHDEPTGAYGGLVYLKRAVQSALRESIESIDPVERRFQHYLFVGLDHCVEVVATEELSVTPFASFEEACSWAGVVPVEFRQ